MAGKWILGPTDFGRMENERKNLKLEIRFSNILMDAMKIWQIFNA